MVGNDAFKRSNHQQDTQVQSGKNVRGKRISAGFVSEVELPGMLDLEEWPTTKLVTVSVAHVM